MEMLNSSFELFSIPETFQRVDGAHSLDLYIGIDENLRWALLLICDAEPPTIASSKMISVQKKRRSDGRWTLTFSLVDEMYKEMFLLFCGDIIDSSRTISDKKKAVSFIGKRYHEWQEMLATSRGDLLSANEVKGLLGEMFFLCTRLAADYGIEKAALSWTGPKKLHQDFIVDDTWYEVKTISSSRSEVSISSIKQLDCSNAGTLVVIYADRTSLTNHQSLNLNQLYFQIMEQLNDDSVKSEFSAMLLQYGYYPRPEYETSDYTYDIKKVELYLVSASFPCLRQATIPASITEANYTISLPSILPFRED